MMDDRDANVLVSVRDRIGHLCLNRPRALNALSREMIQQITRTLDAWADDNRIEAVLISGEGDRAFCSGVDVKSVYMTGKSSDLGRAPSLPADLFRDEYTMDHRVATFPKPCVAYWDGIVMGGGVGLSIMGSHRIATDRTRFAMPETGIGLFPDVGASYFLSRMGPIGKLLGLTGLAIDGAAAFSLGLATHHVTPLPVDRLLDAIVDQGLDLALRSLAVEPTPSDDWDAIRSVADCCFDSDRIESVLRSLEELARGDSRLSQTAAQIRQRLSERCPTSLKLTMEQFRRGATMSYVDCLVMEYRLSQACLARDDFFEGVRAVLVDKDQSPRWSPATVDQVDGETVAFCFESLGERDLRL